MKKEYWNRCIYCGKFIGYSDFDDGKAESAAFITEVGSFDWPSDECKHYHKKCNLEYNKKWSIK